ncbi:PP2C family protein-serine/threonine phosphatase [Streptomyces sp. NPDC048639]|uniref:PP2C family protein-serine/threonine phosphatase n=1 Tax=Streptomyces sp. NPDC048639 TaxID=3365581 RepID=UPI0037176AD6
MGRRTEPRKAAGRGIMRWVRLLPVLILIGGAAVDYFTSPEFSAAAFYSAAPMAGAPVLSLPALVLTGLAACGTDVVLLLHFDYLDSPGGRSELASVATVSAVAIVINRLLHRSDMRLRSARTIALAVQRAVLPQPPSRIGTLRIAARYEAAHSGARIGGDLYAVQDTPHGVRGIVGDVRGKGLEAVETLDVVLGAFREAAENERTIADLAARIERSLEREAARRVNLDDVEGFITAVLAEIPHRGGELRLFNRGHPAPLVLFEGEVRRAEPSRHELPLGLGGLSPGQPVIDTVAFPEGAALLLHTDGLTEARNREGAFFDPVAVLTGRAFRDPDALLTALLADVLGHTGGRTSDDMALLAIERNSAGG